MARIENQLAIHYTNTDNVLGKSLPQEIYLGSFKYAPQLMKLFAPGREIRLSNRETEILNLFCRSVNEPIDRGS